MLGARSERLKFLDNWNSRVRTFAEKNLHFHGSAQASGNPLVNKGLSVGHTVGSALVEVESNWNLWSCCSSSGKKQKKET